MKLEDRAGFQVNLDLHLVIKDPKLSNLKQVYLACANLKAFSLRKLSIGFCTVWITDEGNEFGDKKWRDVSYLGDLSTLDRRNLKAQSLVKLEEVKLGSQKISIVKMFSVHTKTKLAGDFKFLWFEERLDFEKNSIFVTDISVNGRPH